MDNFPELDAKVHWDDCDMDDRTFWFHFAVPAVESTKRKQERKRLMSQVRKAVARCKNRVRDYVDKETSYEASWSLSESPVARYSFFDKKKEFDTYEGNTWIYKLTLWG